MNAKTTMHKDGVEGYYPVSGTEHISCIVQHSPFESRPVKSCVVSGSHTFLIANSYQVSYLTTTSAILYRNHHIFPKTCASRVEVLERQRRVADMV